MNKLVKLCVFVGLLLCATTLFAKDRVQILNSDSLGAVYINAGRIFSLYVDQARDLLKPENAGELEKIEVQMSTHFPGKFSFADFFKKLDSFAESKIFVPDGAFWLSIDEELRPALSISAKIKPLELFEFVQKRLGSKKIVPGKNEKNLLEFEIPTPGYNMTLSVADDGIILSAASAKGKEDLARWKSLAANAANQSTLIALEVDVNRIKSWLAEKAQGSKRSESFECLSNFKVLSAALQLYAVDNGKEMDSLDQALLKTEGYIAEGIYCPKAGKYSLNTDKELVCSIHGTVNEPVWSKKIPRVDASTYLKPFESFVVLVNATGAEIKAKINDKNLLEQWVAIGKQQMLAVRQMANTQMGQLPEDQRQKGLKLIDSIKIVVDGGWLNVSIAGLDEKTVISGITGITGAAAAIVTPYFKKARAAMRNRISDRRTKRAELAGNLDKGYVECNYSRKPLYMALENFLVEEDNLPETFGFDYLKEKGYLQSIPECPAGGKYELMRDGMDYDIKCSMHDHD
ncbi:MAG: hypothetical protein KKB51_18015 [Candidatus Riflebacteria bacterium]|nr:hypothetical protein [Candidatus Riflebacteria bacterium]